MLVTEDAISLLRKIKDDTPLLMDNISRRIRPELMKEISTFLEEWDKEEDHRWDPFKGGGYK